MRRDNTCLRRCSPPQRMSWMAWWCRWATPSAMGSWPDSVLNLRTGARRKEDEYPAWLFVVPEEASAAQVAAGGGSPTKGMHARHGYFLRPLSCCYGRLRAADRDAHL